jgi:biopolymer transport protein ExbD
MVTGTDLETLKQALVGAVGPERKLPLLIKADAKAEHRAVMRVLDAAGQLGLSQIAFAAARSDTADNRPSVERTDSGSEASR